MYSNSNLLAIEPCQFSYNIGISDFHVKKSEENLEIMTPVQATKDFWGLNSIYMKINL